MDYILITGLGRSGSKWLASFLAALKPPDRFVGHEIVSNFDRQAWSLMSAGTWKAAEFWEERRRALRKRTRSESILEVSSAPRHFLDGFKKAFPDGQLGLLVRDARKVVPSVAERTHYGALKRTPPSRRPDPAWLGFNVPNWANLPYLSKICWLWTMGNEAVIPHAECHVRLEDLISSYDVVIRLCEWCGITPERAVWEARRVSPVNSGHHRYPPFEKWKTSQQQAFWSICGRTREHFQYQ